MQKLVTLTCQNPECEKEFQGRKQNDYVSKFCGNNCSARHRVICPELYPNRHTFKKTLKVGHTKIRKEKKTKTGIVIKYRYVIVENDKGELVYVRNDKYIWELENGPTPEGYFIYHIDEDRINDDIENLECIPTGEAISRYSKFKKKIPIGNTKIVITSNSKERRFINIGDGTGNTNYIRHDKYVWETLNGPIPKEYTIYHIDGDSVNDNIKNLECITISEAFSRYRILRESVYDLTNPSHIKRIVEGCKKGNRKVQKKLYDMMYGKCMKIALRYSDADSAKDILNESFFKVFKGMNKVDASKKNLEGWIVKIVVNTGIDFTRKYNKINFLTNSIDDTFGDENTDYIFNKINVEENFSEKSDSDYIMEIIQGLSPAYKLVFNLVVMEGFSHREVSEKLGISESTSKSNLSKAKKNLKEKILKFYHEEEKRILNLENYEAIPEYEERRRYEIA